MEKSNSDRAVRSLVRLASAGATARTLNLIHTWRKFGRDEEYRAAPMFNNPALNRSILVKHRLRRNEAEEFQSFAQTSTKVLLPIDVTDLKMGARYFFVGLRGYPEMLSELKVDEHDANLLALIDSLPSLDPFLMRERLKRSGFEPARLYFDLSDADMKKMMAFAAHELRPLIGRSSVGEEAGREHGAARLAAKILANEGDANMEPMRLAMNMDRTEFEEGVFCWKGFIYYKWTLADLLPQAEPIGKEIGEVKGQGPMSMDDKIYLGRSKTNLRKNLTAACRSVTKTIKVYDDAFRGLTHKDRPQDFRDFLRQAPALFQEIGERLGGVQHIITFWRYRFPEGQRVKIPSEELVELFKEFESSLNFDADAQR